MYLTVLWACLSSLLLSSTHCLQIGSRKKIVFLESFTQCPANESVIIPHDDFEEEFMMLVHFSASMMGAMNVLVKVEGEEALGEVVAYHLGRGEAFSVLFYAPEEWCKWSREMVKVLDEEVYRIRTMIYAVDGYRYPRFNSKYAVFGFPTLLLFKDGEVIRYTGKIDSNLLLAWYAGHVGSIWNDPGGMCVMHFMTRIYYPRFPPFVSTYEILRPSSVIAPPSPDPFLHLSLLYVAGCFIYAIFLIKSALSSCKQALMDWKRR